MTNEINKANDSKGVSESSRTDTFLGHEDMSCSMTEQTKMPFYLNLLADIQLKTCHVIMPSTPVIYFKSPPEMSNPLPEDENPDNKGSDFPGTDVLGRYFHMTREIHIYMDLIKQHANGNSINVDTLLQIVLIHEIMHAINHTGVTKREIKNLLSPDENTDYNDFLAKRCALVNNMTRSQSEFQAQLGTYHYIKESKVVNPDAAEVFLKFMPKQPAIYRIDEEYLNTPANRLWLYMTLSRQELIPMTLGFMKSTLIAGVPDNNKIKVDNIMELL